MTISIRTRLAFIFVSLSLLMVVLTIYSISVSYNTLYSEQGKSSIFLANLFLERITYNIYLKIQDFRNYGMNLVIQRALKESNAFYENLPRRDEYILNQDKLWTDAPKETFTPFISALIDNDMSDNLRQRFVKHYETVYGYISNKGLSISNRYGVNIAQSQKTKDFYQADEIWWREARDKGFYVSDMLIDEANGVMGLRLGVRIDDAAGEFIGVLKGIVEINKFIREEKVSFFRYLTTEIELISETGKLLYSSKTFHFLEDITQQEYFRKIGKENDFFSAYKGGSKKLCAYARTKTFGSFQGPTWILLLDHDESEVLKPIYLLQNNIIIASAVLIITSLVISLLLARSINEPLKRLKKGAEIIGAGNLDYTIGSESKDEIGQLSGAFDRMVYNLKKVTASRDELNKEMGERKRAEKRFKESQAQLIQAEKMSALGTLTAGVAHELNNPLMCILNYIQYCIKNIRSSSKLYGILMDATQEVGKCIAIVKNLLTFSHIGGEGERYINVQFREIVERVLRLLSYKISLAKVKITLDIPNPELSIRMRANEIQQVLLNLINNAINALEKKEDKQIVIALEKKNGTVHLFIEDNGCGIEEKNMPYIFDPFFTTKRVGEGTGLGLSICQSIIADHEGTITCTSKVGEGTIFDIFLPIRKKNSKED
jgi:signal transduction histidine kinase